jgi:hypothetical protein
VAAISEPAGIAKAKNGRQVEWEDDRLLDRRQFRTKLSDDGAGALGGIDTLIVGL